MIESLAGGPYGRGALVARIGRFAVTGVLCLGLQYAVLRALRHENFSPGIAAFVGYCLSAELNFILSYRFTWSDSPRRRGVGLLATWASFNAAVLFSALANSEVYVSCRSDVGDVIALGLATVTSTTLNFVVNHFLVLTPERRPGGVLP